MSGPGEPDAHDWFRGARPTGTARTPRPVGEAFGHLRRMSAGGGPGTGADGDDGGDGDGDRDGERKPIWFTAAAHHGTAESSAEATEPAASVIDQVSAGPGVVPELVMALADAASAEPAEPIPADFTSAEPTSAEPTFIEPTPTPESEGRVRLQALTGGLADLSDALAAIGVQSVALRSTTPGRPSVPPSSPSDAPRSAADFRVRCPDCGPQFVAVADVRFVETGDGAEANRYLFTCPSCQARVRRPAGPELAEILKSSGVATLALRRGPGQGL